ncbi:hypothetical protein BJ165DRAFT_1533981 [Panaeolus papilionaceus]|nr:hypothetical protein BJ165DRAFT_1533981 [Panaeolus papilionaceus]
MQIWPSIEDLEKVFCLEDVVDSGSEREQGYRILSTGNSHISNSHSTSFFHKLLSIQALGLNIDPNSNRTNLNIKRAEEWLQPAHEIWLSFAGLLHISIISGRGTEMLKHQITNSQNSCQWRHLFFDKDANMARLDSNYHKGQTITSQHKHNSRYIPFELWRLTYLLIKVVRPVELLILRTARDLSENDSKTLGSTYYNYLFASNGQMWKESTHSNVLGTVLRDITGYHITLREWHQISIAIQIKFLQFITPKTSNGDVAKAVHKLSGHTARKEHGSTVDDERHQSWSASLEYQTLLGFPATRNDAHNRPPIPAKVFSTPPKAPSSENKKPKVQTRKKLPPSQPITPRVTRSKTHRLPRKAPDARDMLTPPTCKLAATHNTQPPSSISFRSPFSSEPPSSEDEHWVDDSDDSEWVG